MPLTRVALLGRPLAGTEPPPEYTEAAAGLTRVLAQQEIRLAEPGETADGFVALPGNSATLKLLFATCLDSPGPGVKDPPCGLLNTADFFSRLLPGLDDEAMERFAREAQRGRLVMDRDPAALVQAMAGYLPPETRRTA